MEANLAERKVNLFTVTKEMKVESDLLEDIRKRGPSTQLKWNQKAKELSEFGEVFAVTLKQIARGEREEAELTTIRVKMDALKMEIQNLQDLIDILKKTEIESGVKVAKLGEKVRGASHALWFEISRLESEKIKESDAAATPILRSYAAYVLSGLGENFGYFLESRFNGFKIDLVKIMDDLKSEYLPPSKKGGV